MSQFCRICALPLILLLVGCTASSSTPTPGAAPAAVCATQSATANNPAQCTALDAQSARIEAVSGGQSTYRADGFSITLDGVVILRYEADTTTLQVESGSVVLSTQARLQTLRAGDEAVIQQRTLAQTAEPPTHTVIPPTAPQTDACYAPSDWDGTYTVKRGDTLAGIAQRHDVLMDALVGANCIENPDALQPGDMLRVPQSLESDATATAPYIVFVADAYVVEAGECTTLRWEAPGAESVTLNGEEIALMGSQPLCPDSATEYTLNVQFPGDVEIERTISISVR